MLEFSTFSALEDHLEQEPGYIEASLRPTGNPQRDEHGGDVYETWPYSYSVMVASTNTYRDHVCLIQHITYADETESWGLAMPVIGGPSEYVPRPFSLVGWVSRDGETATPIVQTGTQAIQPVNMRLDSGVMVECDSESRTYVKASFWKQLLVAFGLENIIACWTRFNEGDFVRVFIDAPNTNAAWDSNTVYIPGTVVTNDNKLYACIYPGTSGETGPSGTTTDIVDGSCHWMHVKTLTSDGWVEAFEFGEVITIFGDNPYGTPYPTIPSTAEDGRASWIPAYCRVRVDVYMATVDPMTGADTYPNGPASRGPFMDLDVIGKINRQ